MSVRANALERDLPALNRNARPGDRQAVAQATSPDNNVARSGIDGDALA